MAKLGWNNKQKGQLLIEAMVAVSLMLVGLLGIFGVLSRSLGLSRVAADQFVAVNLASEGIEIAKNLLDSNLKQGLAWNANFVDGEAVPVGYLSSALDGAGSCEGPELYLDPATGFYTCEAITGVSSRFSRVLDIETELSGERINVISTVTWKVRGGFDSSVTVEDHFYNWRDLRG